MSVYKGTPTKMVECGILEEVKMVFNTILKSILLKKNALKAESKFILKNDNPINKSFDLVAEEYFNYLKV